MLIVTGGLAALAALSWPALRGPLDKSRLRGAAKQVRVELAKTRLKAIQTGVAHRFRYQPGNNLFEIAPLEIEEDAQTSAFDAVEDDRSNPVGSSVNSARDHSLAEQTVRKQLPDGVRFVDPSSIGPAADVAESGPEPEAATSFDEFDWSAAAGWSAPIIFYPNGKAADARILLIGQRDFQIPVTLRGLTGIVTVGQLGRRESAPPEERP